jgi:hypothetical protein
MRDKVRPLDENASIGITVLRSREQDNKDVHDARYLSRLLCVFISARSNLNVGGHVRPKGNVNGNPRPGLLGT